MKESSVKYKLVDAEGYTRRGQEGETHWLDGEEKIASGSGNALCSADVLHYYDHPLLAVVFNQIHANILNPRLIEIKIDKQWAHDGCKGGCKKAKFVGCLDLPEISLDQKVTFAIVISLKCYKNTDYWRWATNWLNGSDRTEKSAVKITIRSATGSAAMAAAMAAAKLAALSVHLPAGGHLQVFLAPTAQSVTGLAARSVALSAAKLQSAARSRAVGATANFANVRKLFLKKIVEIVRGK